MEAAPEKKTMDFYNMSDFLRGQSSKIITKLSEKDETAIVLKNGRPMVVLISIERYEQLMRAGAEKSKYVTVTIQYPNASGWDRATEGNRVNHANYAFVFTEN
ncbi:type II toxin-antitoxin system Phd/YefM family antitoxin [uncultured Mobiluncus sp.]|mgnify:CR=1 FL=1|uniref:type II toxin-antitoxin system Phd/YefM family antitoxin n=1 Tax=uncultured Mobiluncus sp. TaxID=293425 RepID=UPI0026257B0E|nr:type II toxin-antitoxin system Phd/YefM family antitoxin [uncultured Mobiluncus sp.]